MISQFIGNPKWNKARDTCGETQAQLTSFDFLVIQDDAAPEKHAPKIKPPQPNCPHRSSKAGSPLKRIE